MCFSGPSSKGPPEAYRINRLDDNDAIGSHIRRYSSIARHLNNAPLPTDRSRGKNNKRFPKRHNNTEKNFPQGGSYYEYISKDYPYHAQNAAGKAFHILPNGERIEVDKGYTRTITDRYKNIHGVAFHPADNPVEHVRAKEIYQQRKRRC